MAARHRGIVSCQYLLCARGTSTGLRVQTNEQVPTYLQRLHSPSANALVSKRTVCTVHCKTPLFAIVSSHTPSFA